MANTNSTHELKVEKVIPKTPAEVYRALGEGRLFLNCGADHELLKIDFRVGGKYSIEFLSYGMKNCGEFLELVPNKRLVFTWCQDYDSNPIPDTRVVVELEDLGGRTSLKLTHSGFTDLENCDAHKGGWSGGLDDLTHEITAGKLRFNRPVALPLEKLYETCKNPSSFFGLMGDAKRGKLDFKVGGRYEIPTKEGAIKGEFLEIVPNQKIIFSLEASPCGEPLTQPTKVSLLFEADDDKDKSWIELVHEGLATPSQQMSHRKGWDTILKHLK